MVSVSGSSAMSSRLSSCCSNSSHASSLSISVRLKGMLLGDDLRHARLDRLEVVGGEGAADLKVVVEAVFDRGADSELRRREEVLDRLGHDVGRRVAEDVERLGALVGDDLDGVAVGDRGVHVDQLATDLAGDRGQRQTRADGLGHAENGRPLGDRLGAAVGKVHGDVRHGALAPRRCETAPLLDGAVWFGTAALVERYCLVLQYGQTCQLSLSALPHSMHGLRSFFMQCGQIRKSCSMGL